MSVLISPHHHQYLLLSVFKIIAVLLGIKWYFIVILVCISLMSNVVEHLLSCILIICLLSLKKCLFCSFTHFLIGLSFYCGVVRNSEFNFLGTEIQSLVVPLAKVFWMIDSPCLKNIIFSHLCFLLLSSSDSLLPPPPPTPRGCESIPAGSFMFASAGPRGFQVFNFGNFTPFRGVKTDSTFPAGNQNLHNPSFCYSEPEEEISFLGQRAKFF